MTLLKSMAEILPQVGEIYRERVDKLSQNIEEIVEQLDSILDQIPPNLKKEVELFLETNREHRAEIENSTLRIDQLFIRMYDALKKGGESNGPAKHESSRIIHGQT